MHGNDVVVFHWIADPQEHYNIAHLDKDDASWVHPLHNSYWLVCVRTTQVHVTTGPKITF